MKKAMCVLLSFVMILSVFFVNADEGEQWANPFSDMDESMWCYTAVTELNKLGVIDDYEIYGPNYTASRGQIVDMLYGLFEKNGGKYEDSSIAKFEDVTPDYWLYTSINWASENGIATGTTETTFEPQNPVTREQMAVFAMRYADKFNVKLPAVNDASQFKDSLTINDYAKSAVIACKLSGLINGYEDGYFRPGNNITKAEAAVIVYTLMNIADAGYSEGELVNTKPGAYDAIYNTYVPEQKPFTALVPKSEAVDLSYFDDCAIVGDSVTLSLQYYCAASGDLGNAKFICSGSLSPMNALWEVSSKSVHPSYMGVKMKVEDAVAKSGVNKVYIMLGINSISMGVDKAINDMITLNERILEKAPHVQIIMESVTPMVAGSSIQSASLNNGKVMEYNSKLERVCQERGWYFINVAEVMRDANGYLISSYCSDKPNMGIHFTYAADAVWCDYLKTHVPEELK